MKNILIIIAASAATLSSNAAIVAGWDWGNISTGSTSVGANYSDLASSDGVASNAYGTFTTSGSFGGLGGNLEYNSSVSITTGTALSGRSGVGSTFADTSKSIALIENGASVEFSANTQGAEYSDFVLSYAAGTRTSGSSTLAWEYKIGSSSYTSIESDSISVAVNSGAAFSLASVISGGTTDIVTFRATASDIDGGLDSAFIDNIQISATAVPEPSTYAAIFGALALAFVAIKRRK